MNMYLINFLMINMMLTIMILLGLAFLTLLERKILGYIQLRKGPNKPSIMGILQPFSDAIKLFNKEWIFMKTFNVLFYLTSPILNMILMLSMWVLIPNFYESFYLNLNILLILCLMSVSVYPTMVMGWSSNSMYSILGMMRSISQTISYEVSLIFIFMSSLLMIESFNIMNFLIYQKYDNLMMIMYPMMSMFIINITAELNRTPFDLAEGESELVSGFNMEYSSAGFALIFMSEYGMIMLMSMLVTIIYLMFNYNFMFLFIKSTFIMIMIIIFRGSLPRVRYDQLMMIAWKIILPSALNLMVHLYMIKCLNTYI